MGGQHDGLFLSGSPPVFTFVYTCVFFWWQINSAAAAAAYTVYVSVRIFVNNYTTLQYK